MRSEPCNICESAGTGRQARLRGVCQPTWEFKSPLSHQKRTVRPIGRNVLFLFIWRLELPRALGNVPAARFNPRRFRAAARVQVSSLAPRNAVVHNTMGYRIFLFFCRRSPYIKQFSEYGGAKVLNTRIFLFYRKFATDFLLCTP